jgi:hypothetical protein
LTQDQLDQRVADPLAEQLLPVLMHRMNNTTQLLSNLEALGRVTGGTDWVSERSQDLSSASVDVDEIGYLLAVVASAKGADLLLARRVAGGLRIMVDAVSDVARRRGRELRIPSHGVPEQSAHIHEGWELPWAVGALLLKAALNQAEGEPLDWQLLQEEGSWVLVSSGTMDDGFVGLRDLVLQRLPESHLDVRREGWSWRFPADWLHLPD